MTPDRLRELTRSPCQGDRIAALETALITAHQMRAGPSPLISLGPCDDYGWELFLRDMREGTGPFAR